MVANRELLKERMNSLREEFFAQLAPRLDEMETAWSNYSAGEDAGAGRIAIGRMHRMAHHLAGSGAIFGYPGISEVAHALDTLLMPLTESDNAPNEQAKAQVRILFDELREAGRVDVTESVRDHFFTAAHFAEARAAKSILIVDEDRPQAAALAFVVREAGYRVRMIGDIERLAGAFVLAPPDLVLMGTAFAGGFKAALDAFRRVCEGMSSVPLIVASGRRDYSVQLVALRGGAAAFVNKTGDFARVVDNLDRVLFARSMSRPRVFIAGAGAARRDAAKLALEEAGCYCETIDNLTNTLSVVDDLHPDLVILDGGFADCTSVEAAIVLSGGRTDLPFLFVSSDKAESKALLSAGVSRRDILSDPIDTDILTGVVIARVESVRSERMKAPRGYLTLPLAVSSPPIPPSANTPSRDARTAPSKRGDTTRRVLIADDDPQLREAYRLTLDQAGFSATTAADGLEAFELATRERFDLLITDHLMPNCSGDTLIARLRALPQTRDLPVIMVTMKRIEGETDRALARNVTGRHKALAYLEKPVTPKTILAAVERFLTPVEAEEL